MVEPEVKKCVKPLISFENGELVYTIETDGAEVISEVKSADIKKSYDLRVPLTATYEITAYATKSGYEDSDVSTATLVWATATLDSETSGAKEIAVDAQPMLISQHAGELIVSGLANGGVIMAYSVDGAQITQAKVMDGSANLDLSSKQGDIVILHIGNKSAKILVK